MRICDCSSDLCSSDLELEFGACKYHTWPAAGLKRFFPLAYNLSLTSHPAEIKLLLIGKKDCFKLLKTLKEGEKGNSFSFPGFNKIYKADLAMGIDRFVELNDDEVRYPESGQAVVDLLMRKAISVRDRKSKRLNSSH